MPPLPNTEAPEACPFTISDRVRLKPTAPGYSWRDGQVGVVVRDDVPIAKAYELGWHHCGVIEVRYDESTRETTHWSNYEPA